MTQTTPLISHVSDTARWVAAYRAQESARSDALFRDHLAARLAGEQGPRIALRSRRVNGSNGWPIITRTKLLDDMIVESVQSGCDCVLNLAAGLDTRPYRLALPASLCWIEADLPAILDDKERALDGATSRCRLRRERVDLADVDQRTALFQQVAHEFGRVLVLTEGLLYYLDEPKVAALGRELLAQAKFQHWLCDISSPSVVEMMRKTMGHDLSNAPMQFAPDSGVGFFEALGWQVRELHVLVREAVRLKRAPWFLRLFTLFPDPDPRHLGRARWGAVVRFGRAAT